MSKKINVDNETMKSLLYYRAKGFNNKVVSDKMLIARATVQRYNKKLREMDETEFLDMFKNLIADSRIRIIKNEDFIE